MAKSSGPGRVSRRAADEVSLLFQGVSDVERLGLTFHSDPSATRQLALQLADLLQVPVDGPLPEEDKSPELGKVERGRQIAAKLCCWGAFAAAVGFVALTVEQKSRDASDITLREVDAQLVERKVVERREGSDGWFLQGTFDFTLEGELVRAEGDLIPDAFYREKLGSTRHRRLPYHIAESMMGDWEVGKVYPGFIHRDYPTHIFFDRPPSGRETRTRRWQYAVTGIVLLLLALLVAPKRDASAS